MTRVFSALVLSLLWTQLAAAQVSLRNGNFFVGYKDIALTGGFEPKIERVYNSKTPFKGMFGWGWGSEYEVKLEVSPDGTVLVQEYGGGADNRFVPVDFKKSQREAAAAEIVAAAKKLQVLTNAKQQADYKKRLMDDANFMAAQYKLFVSKGALKAKNLPVGSQYISHRFSFQYVTKTKDGYIRKFDSGKIEKFNEAGYLVEISDRNNNYIKFARRSDGTIEHLVDNLKRKLVFTYDKGLLKEVKGPNGRATYAYNKNDELTYSKDVAGNEYYYKYSTDRRHNLVSIGYDKKFKESMDIAYHSMNLNENVKTVKDRDGSVSEYSYVMNKSNPDFYSVSVHLKDKKGKTISKSKYDYFFKTKVTGERWTQKMVTVIDGDKTENIYNEFGLPDAIVRNGEKTTFQYDKKGRVTRKDSPSELTLLKYHPKFGKVTRVDRTSKVGKKTKIWSEFKYNDSTGNLVSAKNSEKKGVAIVYDGLGRIKSMVDHEKRRLDFKYNENSKPIEIIDPKRGKIIVTYNNSGQVKDVQSTGGRGIASEVTSSFQNLMDIIRPAGVTLSF